VFNQNRPTLPLSCLHPVRITILSQREGEIYILFNKDKNNTTIPLIMQTSKQGANLHLKI